MVCLQDYHWWWRAFLTSGFTAIYFFIYCVHFYFTKLEMQDSASGFLYFGYTFIIVFAFFLLTGERSCWLHPCRSPSFCRSWVNWSVVFTIVFLLTSE